MDLSNYAAEASVEQSHWWYEGRRKLFAGEIGRLSLSSDARVLDVGSGSGANLRLLRSLGFARAKGLEPSDVAIEFCVEKGLGPVHKGDLCHLPFAERSFELVLAADVVEHVEDDGLALREIHRVLAPGGWALITVPAFQSLWSRHDEMSHHRRRYRLDALRDRIRSADLALSHAYYFNYLLFVPIWVARRLMAAFSVTLASETRVNTPALNRLLAAVFSLDIHTAARLRPPFGVSILALAKRRA